MIKCLIWDLDDTLWEGTLRENPNVTISESRLALLKALDKAGILQSIASRNDCESATEKLNELGVLDYFLYPQCNYGSKAESIRTIVKKLNIGMDSIGYIDDNPFELSEAKYFLPDIFTYNADEADRLLTYPEFQSGIITGESSARREMMLLRQQREEAGQAFAGSRGNFLASCGMELTVRPARAEDAARVYELTARTNQLNSLAESVDMDLIRGYIERGNSLFTAALRDKFGCHGIVGACFLEAGPSAAAIQLFCVSCRVEGRGVGAAFLSEVIRFAQNQSEAITEITCKYKPSAANRPALILLKTLGFKRNERGDYSVKTPLGFKGPKWIKIRWE